MVVYSAGKLQVMSMALVGIAVSMVSVQMV